MKPVYLEFCGINSFSETAKIDFDSLLKSGVFGIFGDTGSGKSTILDSIHFALYGEIDRAPKSFNDCINYRSETASVLFDFEITENGERHAYRVKRERKRKNGTTKAYLYQRTENGALLSIAEGSRDVDLALEEIIGLTFDDFKTCIALPQGDFASLVKATPSERVKLVARLFNLEKYGERLSRAVNDKYRIAEEEVELLKARMSENDGGDMEKIENVKKEFNEQKSALIQAEKELSIAETNEKQAQAQADKKRDYDALCLQKKTLDEKKERMSELRTLLTAYPKAEAVLSVANQVQNTKEKLVRTQELKRVSAEEYERANQVLASAKERIEKEDYEPRLLQISLNLQKVESAKNDLLAAQQSKRELENCRKEFKELKNQCVEEDFQGKKENLEEQITALGEDDTLLGYLKHNYKGVLLADAYGEFRLDLNALKEKYPQTQEDISILLKKYEGKPLNAGETLDITQINLAFKQVEQKRKQLKAELESLEKRKRIYEENESKLKTLIERGKILQKTAEEMEEKVAFTKALGTEDTLKAELEKVKNEQAQAKRTLERAQESVSGKFAETQKQEGLVSMLSQSLEEQTSILEKALVENGFESVESAKSLLNKLGDKDRAERETQVFFDTYGAVLSKIEQTDMRAFADFDETALFMAKDKKRTAQERANALHHTVGALEQQFTRLEKLREKYQEQAQELVKKQEYLKLCDELKQLVKSNKFLEFIASEYLQEICLSASKTLLSLTSNRYFLQYDKEFRVGDNLDSGNMRSVKTLSGGETFLVSLSLALSLSNAICMDALRPIEFFFLDEGFGTLDEKLVDTVMDVLGKLSKSFAVGLISHVEELKHRIENKILVTGATETHGSQVKVECM